jgi:hypothetical protein
MFRWLALAGAALAETAAADPPRLQVPVACEVGRTCFIQNYLDQDPSPESKDFACGTLTYDGHNGTDFRVPTLKSQWTFWPPRTDACCGRGTTSPTSRSAPPGGVRRCRGRSAATGSSSPTRTVWKPSTATWLRAASA